MAFIILFGGYSMTNAQTEHQQRIENSPQHSGKSFQNPYELPLIDGWWDYLYRQFIASRVDPAPKEDILWGTPWAVS